ncbi:DUF6163 family protein [Coralliovum pocilloporae]|uniref:DUF6163 family protein n=1 Tax=Coralliovum pocilloporae TaxID=3066369 RepID=UPI0033073117
MISRTDRSGLPGQSAAIRSDLALSVFLRVMAAVLMVRGILRWADLTGLSGHPEGLLGLSVSGQVELVFFAVVLLVASTGLWILATWGVVVWMAAAFLNAVLAVFFPEITQFNAPLLIFDGVTVLIYLCLLYVRERIHAQQGY